MGNRDTEPLKNKKVKGKGKGQMTVAKTEQTIRLLKSRAVPADKHPHSRSNTIHACDPNLVSGASDLRVGWRTHESNFDLWGVA